MEFATLADFPALAVAIYLIARRRVRPGLPELILTATPAVSMFWTASPEATALYTMRVGALSVLVRWALDNADPKAVIIGLATALTGQALASIQGTIDGGRNHAFYRYATITGAAGWSLALAGAYSPRPAGYIGVLVGLVTIAASGARAAVLALVVLIRRPRLPASPALRLGILGVVIAVVGLVAIAMQYRGVTNGYGQVDNLKLRYATAFDIGPDWLAHLCANIPPYNDQLPPNYERVEAEGFAYVPLCGYPEYSLGGAGAGAYLEANLWPRPHNIYSILIREVGVFAYWPAALFIWAAWRRKLPAGLVASILIMGLLDDTPISQPEGAYFLAAVIYAGLTWQRAHA